MRLALTGGGTGGHVYPALEVGRLAREDGDEVRYFGSLRGLEGSASQQAGFEFYGVPASPIPNLLSLDGLRAVVALLKSTRQVSRQFASWTPDVLFATGGYSSGAAIRAANARGIPVVLHEQNSIPGRAIKMAGDKATKVCTVFKQTCNYFDKTKVVETGMPIRDTLVSAAEAAAPREFTTLASGGSQGARAVNGAVRKLVAEIGADRWTHIAGKALFAEVQSDNLYMPEGYRVEPFLQADDMATALSESNLAIVRAGCGTIAELALFGIPAIYIPLPSSFANHQFHNAKEIESIGGGNVLSQEDLTAERLVTNWKNWRLDRDRRERASAALKSWGKPDAGARVLQVVKEAVS